MGRKVTVFSDLTGAEVPEDELGRLIIRSHPELNGPAVHLEALLDEIAALDQANVPMVTIEWQPPGRRRSQDLHAPREGLGQARKERPEQDPVPWTDSWSIRSCRWG